MSNRVDQGAARRSMSKDNDEILLSLRDLLLAELRIQLGYAQDQVDDSLFSLAERAETTAIQNEYFDGMRELRARRNDMVMALENAIRHGFERFPEPVPESAYSDQSDSKMELSLFAEDELEEVMAANAMVSRAESRFAQELFLINTRLSELAGGQDVVNEICPCGPRQIVEAFRVACKPLDITDRIRIVLFKLFDEHVVEDLGSVLKALNGQLVKEGILPDLTYEVAKKNEADKKAAGSGPGEAEAETGDEAQLGEGGMPGGAPMPGAQPGWGPAGASGASPRQGTSAQAGPPAGSSAMRKPQTPEEQQQAVMFDQMRRLLGGWRQVADSASGFFRGSPDSEQGAEMADMGAAPPAPMGEAVPVGERDLVSVLSLMQGQVSAGAIGAGKPLSAPEIKQSLTQNLDYLSPEKGVDLSPRNQDTIDLVSMLFEYIHTDSGIHRSARSEIGRLQVPLLKAALIDPNFFTAPNHPARSFVNTLADAGELYAQGGEQDEGLLEQLKAAVGQILDDFDDDVEIFTSASRNLGRDITRRKRRAEQSEKRVVQAAEGRDKMRVALAKARELIKELTQDVKLPYTARRLLEEPWTDVLVMTFARDGLDGDEARQVSETARDLVQSLTPTDDEAVRKEVRGKLKGLRDAIRDGLHKVGYHPDEVTKLVSELSYCHGWALAAPAGTKLPKKLEEGSMRDGERPEEGIRSAVDEHLDRVGKSGGGFATGVWKAVRSEDVPAKKEKKSLSDAEKIRIAELKRVRFGTWFEFSINQQGDTRRMKLAWLSPVTETCLFVDHRGLKVGEKSMAELAKELDLGNARIVEMEERKPFFDRAFQAIMERLRGFQRRMGFAESGAAAS